MLSIYYQQDFFKDQNEVRENIQSLSQNQLSSIDGLSIDFLRQFKDKIDFDVIFHAPYNNYNKDQKIVKEFWRTSDEQYHKLYKRKY